MKQDDVYFYSYYQFYLEGFNKCFKVSKINIIYNYWKGRKLNVDIYKQ